MENLSMSPEKKLTPAASRAKTLSLAFLVMMIFACIGLDQVSKIHAQNSLMVWQDPDNLSGYQGRRFPLITLGSQDLQADEFFLSFNTNYVRNLGAAWGALSGLDDKVRIPFFYGVTVLAVVIILFYMRATPLHHRLARFALALIMAGAVGNFIDRIRLGYVIDFIDVRWNIFGWRYDFPNFNVADSAITVGVSFLIFDMLILENIRRRKYPSVAATGSNE
jgi:signal peptidase II